MHIHESKLHNLVTILRKSPIIFEETKQGKMDILGRYMYAKGINLHSVSMTVGLYFGIVPTVWYFFCFSSHEYLMHHFAKPIIHTICPTICCV
jgi:hypothetical protein